MILIDDAAGAALDGGLTEAERALAPACIAAVAVGGEIIAARTNGQPRDLGGPTSWETVFRIASMTKSFLAAAALGLRDEGLLDLTAPISEYVPGVRLMYGEEIQPVTGAQLLSNCSGLPEDNAWADRQLGTSRGDILELARAGLRLTRRPGTAYQYSNIGQSLVGRAIEAVTGAPVEEIIRQRLLDPLDLEHTRFTAMDYPPGTDLAYGWRTYDKGVTFRREPYVGSGAFACIGGLFSTVDDIAVWMRFLGSAWSDDPWRPDLLSPASRREMQCIHTPIPIGGEEADRWVDARGYGYGLKVELHRRYGRIVSHAGGLPGFSSEMRWHPATGTGVVVFGDSDAFKSTRVSTKVMLEYLERVDAPAEVVGPWRETVAAAERADRAIRAGWAVEQLGDAVSDNLLRDEPARVRAARLEELLAEAGAMVDGAPFAERMLCAAHPSELRWRIDCERGALVCDVRLMALAVPVVQTITVQLADATGRKPRDEAPLVADNSRVGRTLEAS